MGVLSLIFLSSAFFEIPTGVFSDKIGRKNTIVIGSFCTLLAFVFYALGFSPFILYIGALLEGLGRSFFSGNNNALLHDTLTELGQEERYPEYLGRISSMFQIAMAIAAIIGGILAGISFSAVMWISVIPQCFCLLLAFRMKEPSLHTKESGNIFSHLGVAIQKFRENKKLRLLSSGSIIYFSMGNSVFEFQQAFYNLVFPVWALGILRTISSGTAAFSYYMSGKVIKKFSAIKILLTGSIIPPFIKIFAALIVTPLSPLLMASMSIFHGVTTVSDSSLQHKEFTQEQRATMGSLVAFGGSICTAIATFTLGIIADHWGVISAMVFGQLVLLTIPLIYWRVYTVYK